MTVVIAHRGNSAVAPQNTLAAFEAAWRAGADMIELDVQLTADGAVVVIHDDDLDATTDGTGRVGDHTLEQVRELDAGSWFSPAFVGTRVPTFDEVVQLLLTRPGTDLLCELKGEWTVEQARKVTGPIVEAGLEERVIVQSFWPGTVAALREAAPQLRRGLLLLEAPEDVVDRCQELGVMTCNPHGMLLVQHPDLLGRLHEAGLQVMVWTLDETAHWAAAVAVGVDAIITNRPDRLAGWLAARQTDSATAPAGV
ncbi:glycerophosphodiester phosphodiesterase [Cellulomonas soli]|uniref:glycerophosphodiester phosphodiesterase n=1 Tax=Cellulomonas soli TaxID=931535 RepID=UPI003F84516A